MPLRKLDTSLEKDTADFLSPVAYDDDAASLHSRSDQDSDSEDDELVAAARNSKELRARDRMVLLEEDEMDELVTKSRLNQDRQRRGSNLALPNPIRMFRRSSKSSSSRVNLLHDYASSSVEDLRDEKRRTARRKRRKDKRDRLLKEAQNGEDGELMQEMEGGGMKYGSSTAESSDREDGKEMDRWRREQRADAKAQSTKSWWKWGFIGITTVVGVTFLSLLAWKLSAGKKHSTASSGSPTLVSNGTALFAPTTLIISLDGFRADFLQRGLTPRLNAFIKEGVSPLWMHPSFPSVTFPNHYTIATGLYPESHGVVGNTFWDPDLEAEFYYTDPDRSLDPKWWGGEPFWVTAEQQGLRTAVHMWPGSEAHVMGVDPSFLDKFNGKEKLPKKVARILEFLDKPGFEDPDADIDDTRPQIIAAYVPNVDAEGHRHGPNSTEVMSVIQEVDGMLDQLFQGLADRNLTDIVNVIIVSDHGMATTDVSRMIQVDDLVDMSKIEHIDGWPLTGIRPKDPKDLELLHAQAAEKGKTNPNFDVYLKDVDMPERYHFSDNDRIAPLWIVPKTGWAIVQREEFDLEQAKITGEDYKPKGIHGYDNEHPLMRAIFIARGPAFPHQPHSKVEVFQNIHVYNILCDSVGMEPVPNNGTLRLPLKPVGLHDTEPPSDLLLDPVVSTSADIAPTEAATAPTETVGVDPVGNQDGDDEIHEQPPAQDATGEEAPLPTKKPENGSEEGQKEGGGEKQGGSLWDKIKSGWDWVTNKVGDFVDSVTGGNEDDDSGEKNS